MTELMPLSYTRSFGVRGNAQTVKLPEPLSYLDQSKLRWVGKVASVSFSRGGETVALCGVTVKSGCAVAWRQGNSLRLEGVEPCQRVVLCLALADGETHEASFVFNQ